MALPDKHQLKFNSHKDAKTLIEAIKKRFEKNTETKKVYKTLLKQQYENFTGSNSESLVQIHDRLQKLVSQLEIHGVSLSQEDVNLKFLRTTTQNLAFVFSSNTDSTTESVSAVAIVSAVCAKMSVSSLPNVDSLSNAMAMLTIRARRFLQRTGRNLGANGPTSLGFDMSKMECYNCHRKGHFSRECRSLKDSRRNGAAEPQRRSVPVETSTSNALVSQCVGVGSYDWSFQAEDEPANYALMAFSSSSSSSNNEVLSCLKACSKAYAQLHSQYDKLTANFYKSQFDVISYQTGLESVEARLLVYKQNESIFEEDIKLLKLEVHNGYYSVPPPYIGTFMPPKPDLVFTTSPTTVETDHSAFPVRLSPTKPEQDLSHTNRPVVHILEDWVFDSEDESETKASQIVLSFVQSTEQVKSPRHSVQHVETSIPAATLKPASPKPASNGKKRNRKACFVCKSVYQLIKDCDYHEKPISTVVPKIKVTQPKQVQPIVTKPKSPIIRHITRRPSPKTSNSPLRVTAVKALVGNSQHALKDKGVIDSGCSRHMTGNMSYLSDFEELNGRYVTFRGNPKGGKFDRKVDEGFLVGYSVGSKAFRVFNSKTRIVQETLHVNFLENNPNVTGSGLHEKTREEIDQQYVLFPVWSSGSTSPQNNDEDADFNGKEPDFDAKKPGSKVNVSPSSSSQSRKQDDKTKKEAKGKSHDTSITVSHIPALRVHKDHPVAQIIGDLSSTTQTRSMTKVVKDQDELSQMFNDDFHTFDFSYGKRAIGTKWVFKNKKDERGIVIRNKARLVAQRHTHEEGIDYEEVFALVARIEAIRLFLAYASFMGFMMYQMHVKSAFLYRTIEEEVYVCQPLGFEDPDHPDKVYKVVKALYGLHQAPRAWYETLANYLLENGFQRGKIDQTLFIKRQKAYERQVPDEFNGGTHILFGSSRKSASTPIDTEKPLLKDHNGEDVDVHTYRSMIGSLMYLTSSRPDIMFVVCACMNDVTRLQALVDKKKVVVTEATIRDALHLNDAEGVDCLPNEEIFAELGRMGYEKPSTKLTSSMASIVICLSSGDLSTHTTKYTSPALTHKVFANMRRVDKGFSRVETPLFESMLVERQVAKEGDADENVGNAAEGDVSTAHGEVSTIAEEPSIPSPRPPTIPPQPSQDILLTSWVQPTPPQSPQKSRALKFYKVAQALEITKLKRRVKKLERRNKVKLLKLRRLQKVRTAQRVETSNDTVMDDVSNQGRMIAEVDADIDVVLEDDKEVADEAKEVADVVKYVEESLQDQRRQAESQAEIYKIDMDHANKVLSMQDDETEPAEVQEVVDVVTTAKLITKVVTASSKTITAASANITATEAQIPDVTLTVAPARVAAAPSRRRKGVVIMDPEEESTTSTIIPAETKSKDKAINHVKRKAKEDVKRYQVLKRKPQTKAQARKNMIMYLKNVAGFKIDYFKGMSYDNIRPIFEAKFNSNVAFLLKTNEQIEEDKNRALQRLNETPAKRAAKRQKLDEEIIEMNNKPYYKIIRADDTHQLYTCSDLEDSEKCTWSNKGQRMEAIGIMWKNELKARGTLLMALPDKHQLKFNIHKDAKTLMEAIEKMFGGNKENKKVQKTLLKQQYENFTGSSSESLDQIHDRLQKLINQLEILRESLSQEDIILKFLRSLPVEWRTHTLIWRNKIDLEDQSLDDLFNSLKIYEAEVKSSSSASSSTQNIAFVSSQNTDSTNEPVSVVASVSAASEKILVFSLPNVDTLKEMDLKWKMAMLTVRARRFLQRTGRNLKANGPTSMGFDMLKVECYNCYRKGHFARECRSPKDTRRNVAAKPQRRNVPVENSTSNALVSQCLESVEARILVYQQNEMIFEDIKLLKLDVPLRDNALVVLRQKFEKAKQERDNLKLKLEKFKTSSKNLSQLLASQTNDKTGLGYNNHVFASSMFDCDEMFSSESDVSMPASPIYDRYQSGEGYHVVPPPYTGTFMPPKPNLVFHDALNVNKTIHIAFNVEFSHTKPDKDLSHTHRPSAPTIED
uniref:Retrovirus-related Pol polyprotein from transposon TNT 1-94 n=1 Tax=Tanacetum cinerariifolium TaxID=118510 RepID=A0A6L2KZG8_TANCI|nr:retrovirus-related Pol polyprotein from transposon TNT 1-94 [Tanacetum cinerariifolium]